MLACCNKKTADRVIPHAITLALVSLLGVGAPFTVQAARAAYGEGAKREDGEQGPSRRFATVDWALTADISFGVPRMGEGGAMGLKSEVLGAMSNGGSAAVMLTGVPGVTDET